jgi:hypothetical protein
VTSSSGYLDVRGISNGDGTANLATGAGGATGTSATRVAPGGLASGQSLKNYSGIITLTAASQTVNLGAVTAGKTYLITDVALSTNDSASGSLLVALQVGIGAVIQAFVSTATPVSMTGIEAQPQGAAGQVIAIIAPAGTAGKQIAYNVLGIEE